MNYYVITETDVSENFWNKKYISGMKAGARECKGSLIEITPEELCNIKKEDKRISIILNGRSSGWIKRNVEAVLKNEFHPILLASHGTVSRHNVSCVGFDFYGIYTSWCEYVKKQGWHNMALLGVNRDAVGDVVKCEAFKDYNTNYNKENIFDVYYIDSSLEECCESFLENADRYDAVLCTNDLVSIVLVTLIRKQKRAEKLHINAFWDSPLSEFMNPKLKTMSLDYAELGRHAIKLSSFLASNPDMASVSATICGKTELKERNFCTLESNTYSDRFFKDKRAQDIYSLEKLFSSMDTIDMQIIDGIVRGISYEQLAEEQVVSVGTIKYRVKRMLTITQKQKRVELVKLILEYLSMDSVAESFDKN